jgi:hypothetical protein
VRIGQCYLDENIQTREEKKEENVKHKERKRKNK